MKLSFKIPKGVSEDDVFKFRQSMESLEIERLEIKDTSRMIHIDIGEHDTYFNHESYTAALRDTTHIISQFIAPEE